MPANDCADIILVAWALTEPMTFEVSQREWEGVHFIVDDVYQ